MFKLEKGMKGANVARTIRFTEPLYEQLNLVAYENALLFNSLVLQCCKYALSQYEKYVS